MMQTSTSAREHYAAERVSFRRNKTHQLSTPKADIKYMTHRIEMEDFPIMVWELNAEICFHGHPAIPGLARFRLYRQKGRYSYVSSQCFINASDTHSQGMYDLACEMAETFDGDLGDVFSTGPVLEFE